MKELTLTPQLRLGVNKKLFKQGKIDDIGNGSAEVQLAIVATTNDVSLSDGYNWTWNYNSNVSIGTSDAINIPMNSRKADFVTIPLDAFKLKVTMHAGGEVNIKLKLDEYDFTLTLTTELLLANIGKPEALAKTWQLEEDIPEIPKPEPIPEEETPEDETPAPNITPIIEDGIFKQLFNKYKWYGVVYLAGVLTRPIIKILNWIF